MNSKYTRDRLRALYLHMGAEIGDPDFNTFEGHSALLVKGKKALLQQLELFRA